MRNFELYSFIVGVFLSSIIWFILWRQVLTRITESYNRKREQLLRDKDELKEEHYRKISSLNTKNIELSTKNSELLTQLQHIQFKLDVFKMERDHDIQGLSDILRQNSRRDEESTLFENKMLAYKKYLI